MDTQTKICVHCKEPINKLASRCPKCGGKNYVWTVGRKIGLGLFGLLVLLIIIGISGGSQPSTETISDSPTLSIGESGFLRLPDINDPEQVICLGPTKESYDQITKAIMSGDTIGLLEIPGAFCVSNGSKAKLIDQAFAVRRVRIEEGVRPVDSDKIGLSGWVAKEFIVKR